MADKTASLEKDHRHGHRERLRARFLKGGADAMQDYELLELLLCTAIPRRDVKPLAKEMIAKFGGYAEVLTASPDRLRAVKGLGEGAVAMIKSIEASAIHLAREKVMNQPVLSSWQALIDYLRTVQAWAERESFRILFMDRKNRLIADEVQGEGSIDHTPVYVREVVKRALELSASAIILVHNHPSGDPRPSRGDIEMTKEVADACKKLEIRLHDHIIVGKHGHASFKSLGLLK